MPQTYTVKGRDSAGNVSVMSSHIERNAALEDEQLLMINNPSIHFWIESSRYWDEEGDGYND